MLKRNTKAIIRLFLILFYLFYHPFQGAYFFLNCIVDAYFHYRFVLQGEGIGILLVVDLLKSFFGRLIELQFHDVDGVVRLHRNVCSSLGSMLRYENAEIGEQGKHDVHHLLIMPLVVGIIAVRHRLKESLE